MSGVKDALGGETTYAYDAAGRLISLTDPLVHTTRYSYDALGRRTGETDALNHITSYTYDALGRMTERQNAAGQKVSYTYDELGRLLSISGAGVDASFTYNAAGQRASMTDALGKTEYTYDASGRLTGVKGPQGDLSYTYDLAGNRTAMTQPGASLAYTYDELNRLSGLSLGSAPLAQYTYNAGGLNDSQAFGNGATTNLSYDADGRLTGLSSRLGQDPLLEIGYTLDERGSRTAETTQIQGADAFSAAYSYDAAGRLVSASLQAPGQQPPEPGKYYLYLPALLRQESKQKTSPAVTQAAGPVVGDDSTAVGEMQSYDYAYTYDAVGNRLTANENGSAANYTYDAANHIRNAGYTYDAAGRMTGDGANTYTYDALNHITAISGKITASYVYDGDGNRVRESVGGTTTSYLLDPARPLPVRIAAVQGSKVTRSFFGLSLVAQSLPDGALEYAHADGLGSIRLVTGADGKVLGHASYTPFGTLLEGSLPTSFAFTGEPQSAGLVYLRARDYSPALGRFLTPDAAPALLIDPQTLNRYTYVRNNPVNATDPSGLCEWWDLGCQAQAAAQKIAEAAQVAYNTLSSATQAAVSTVVTAVKTTVSAVQTGISSVANWMVNSSSSMVENRANSCGSLTSMSADSVITMGGDNVITFGGGNVITFGGGNMQSASNSSLTSTSGGNVITFGGGNVITFGGGNVITFGGGN